MRRIPGPVFSFAAFVSLLTCMAAVALWVRSRWYSDSVFYRPTARWDCVVRSSSPYSTWPEFRGIGLSLRRDRYFQGLKTWGFDSSPRQPPPKPPRVDIIRQRSSGHLNEGDNVLYVSEDEFFPQGREFLGVRFGWGKSPRFFDIIYFPGQPVPAPEIATCAYVILPYWLAALLCSLLPGRWLTVRYWQRRRTHRGLCTVCGYDLRATPGRCPECGTTLTSPGRN